MNHEGKQNLTNSEELLSNHQERDQGYYYTLFEFAPAGYCILDREGTVLNINQTGIDLLGVTKAEIISSNFRKFITEESGEVFEGFCRTIVQTNTKHMCILSCADKIIPVSWIRAEGCARPDTGDTERYIAMTFSDITEEKNTELTMQRSEQGLLYAQELCDILTMDSGIIIAVHDTKQKYIYYNKAYQEEVKRQTGKEISIGSRIIEIFKKPNGQHKIAETTLSKNFNGDSSDCIMKTIEDEKYQRMYHVFRIPIRNREDIVIGTGEIAYDITGQKQTEKELLEIREYLDKLINYANAPIIVWNPEFSITRFNKAFEHLSGRDAHDVLGKPISILFPEDYLTDAMNLIVRTSYGDQWESVEIPILHTNGDVRTVLWNSATITGTDGCTAIATIAQGQDITARKKIEDKYRNRAKEYKKLNNELSDEVSQRIITENRLKNTLSLLNATLESTTDGILAVGLKGSITCYNHNFTSMWHIPSGIIKNGAPVTTLYGFLNNVKNTEKWGGYKDNKIPLDQGSFAQIEHRDGRFFEQYSRPQKIGDTIIGRVWSFRDITERKNVEENLLASFHEKEVMLREIHHRVKNNLQMISGLLDMTRMRTSDDYTTSVLTDMMMKIRTMAQIHTRLYESREFEKVSLTDMFRDQIAALSNIYSYQGYVITCEIDTKEIFLPVDKAIPVALVVNEILSNAYKHAFKGRDKGRIKIITDQNGEDVRIRIQDDGIGMADSFDINCSSSLGMKLIRTLIQHQLKGSFMMNSRNGTNITVEFPMADRE